MNPNPPRPGKTNSPETPTSITDPESTPPHDATAEAAALCAMWSDQAAGRVGLEMLAEASFYVPRYAALFRATRDILAEGGVLDLSLIKARLLQSNAFALCGGDEGLGRVLETSAHPANIERYCRILRQRQADREARERGFAMLKQAAAGQGAEALGVDFQPDLDGLEQLDREAELEIQGKRLDPGWPKFPILSRCKALLPGSLTVLCGSPGASKSLFILECLWRWVLMGLPVAALELEKGAGFHLRRALAQERGQAALTDDYHVRRNPEAFRQARAEADKFLKQLRLRLDAPRHDQAITCAYILDWLRQRAASNRILIVDPISIADGGSRVWEAHRKLVAEAGALATKHGMSIVFVTHPRSGPAGYAMAPSLENISGGTAFQKFTDTCFWLQAHDQDSEEVETHDGQIKREPFNRTLYLLKTRMGQGSGQRVAYWFDVKSLRHVELGRRPSKKSGFQLKSN